jgi:hypothetical protein
LFVVSITTVPSQFRTPETASAVWRHWVAITTISPNATTSAVVPALAFGPSSAARPAKDAGPREFESFTRCPVPTNSRASVVPILPAPMIPMSMPAR